MAHFSRGGSRNVLLIFYSASRERTRDPMKRYAIRASAVAVQDK